MPKPIASRTTDSMLAYPSSRVDRIPLKEFLPPSFSFPLINRSRHYDVEIGSRIFSLLQYRRELRVHLSDVQPLSKHLADLLKHLPRRQSACHNQPKLFYLEFFTRSLKKQMRRTSR